MLSKFPDEAQSFLLIDAQKRDLVTARRAHLLAILWRERYISRQGLIERLERLLGNACFGEKSWEDTFYRDMRVVKAALKYAGYKLKYSRKSEQAGYYIAGEPVLHPDQVKSLVAALNEVDPQQIEIYKKLPPAQKFFQACSIINFAQKVSNTRSNP